MPYNMTREKYLFGCVGCAAQQIGEKLKEGTFPGGTWKDLWSPDRTNGSIEPEIKEQSKSTLLILLPTAETNKFFSVIISEWGNAAILKHKDFLDYYLCRATLTLFSPTPLRFLCTEGVWHELKHLPQYSMSLHLWCVGAACRCFRG